MTPLKLIIYGNGQMALLLLDFVRSHFDVVGFTVDRALIKAPHLAGLPLVPFEEVELHFSPQDHQMITAVGYREMNQLRADRHGEGLRKGYQFARYIHPSVVIHPTVTVGSNSVVLDHVALHPYTSVGKGVFICSNSSIGHGCSIGNYCWINSGAAFGGETKVMEHCFFGMNSTVSDNITVGSHTYVGAQTLLSRSSAPGEVYITAPGEKFPLQSRDFLKFLSRKVG